MSRIVKEYDQRLSEFLDVAQLLFFSKGYETTSVQDIIKTVGVAKGTFYHYFNAKADVLEMIVDRMFDQIMDVVQPMLDDPALSAIDKLLLLTRLSNQWKVDQKDVMIETGRALYQDENVLLREKMRLKYNAALLPELSGVVQQGVDAGVFDVQHPTEAAEIVMAVLQSFSDAFARVLINDHDNKDLLAHIRRQIETTNQSVARILGTTQSALPILDPTMLDGWLTNDATPTD